MTQLMKRAKIFFGEPHPSVTIRWRRPKIARQASGQPLSLIVNLDKLLPAVMAAIHLANFVGVGDKLKCVVRTIVAAAAKPRTGTLPVQ